MSEPQTRTVPPDPEPLPEPTGEWKGPSAPAEPQALDAPTVTRTVASTPGPQHPERRTDSDDTERDRAATEAELPQIPGFLVQAEIGRGGMGVVYRAIHMEMAKTVALKVVYTLGRDPEMVRGRFAREVQALARLEHPNVVPIYHAGQWHGFPYFTMKFVPRGALAKQLDRFHGNPAACARLVARVARAVQALHDHKVIHRDLKPLNILLGDSDEPLVADFGLAKWLDDVPVTAGTPGYPISGTGVPMGTRQYMAPEQTRGERTEFPEAVDIWALGVTLYELLAGVRPFPDDGRSDLAERICEEPAPPLPDTVPAELAAVVGKCLAKRPGDRYATAAAVAEDLERWLAGQPVVAPLISPAPPVEPVSEPKPPRRRWLVPLALAGLAALIAVPAAIFAPQTEREKSIPERLQAGEPVWLIGAKYGTMHPIRTVPGCDALLTRSADGLCQLTSVATGAVELYSGPLPLPVLFEGELAAKSPRVGSTVSGVYVGHKQTPAGNKLHQTMVWFTNRLSWDRENPARPMWHSSVAADLPWWQQDPPGIQTTLASSRAEIANPGVNNDLRWQQWSILITDSGYHCTWEDGQKNRHHFEVPTELIQTELRAVAQRHDPASGLGLSGSHWDPESAC